MTTATTTTTRSFLSLLHPLWRRCCLSVVLCLVVGSTTRTTTTQVHAQISNSQYPLFAQSVVHCDEMIALHRWEGSCCSLNVTAGNGCILNVMDGYCNVRGQVWSLQFNSTYDVVPCPPSEYTNDMMGMKKTDYDSDTTTTTSGCGVASSTSTARWGVALAVVVGAVVSASSALAGGME